jgi:hypothetical protein
MSFFHDSMILLFGILFSAIILILILTDTSISHASKEDIEPKIVKIDVSDLDTCYVYHYSRTKFTMSCVTHK